MTAVAVPLEGGATEREVAHDLVRRALPLVPVALLVGAIGWGVDGALSALFGLALVCANFLLSAALIGNAAKISLPLLMAAVLGGYFGRRPVYAALCVISLVTMVAFYQQGRLYDGGKPPFDAAFVLFAGLLGLVSAAFYGWLPLYLPELFPTAVRATGQGFGYNFGRVIAAVGQLQMGNLLAAFNRDYAQACAVVAGVYLAGLVLIALAPETKGKPLPE